jgi:small subunit ribosomal protein S13
MRIAGVTIPDKKRLEIGLSYLYGIGKTLAKEILDQAKIPRDKQAKDLTPEEENSIRKILANYKTEGDLRREIIANIKRLKEVGSYRGMRHSRKLPVWGQRTKTNSRTVRGNKRVTMTSGKRKLEKK